MIVRALQEIENTERDVCWGNSRSRRSCSSATGWAIVSPTPSWRREPKSLLEYKNHMEACYCIEGEGEIESEHKNVYPLRPGTMYALDRHDKHYLRAFASSRRR